MSTWPPAPDLASIQELVRDADTEGFIANGSPADEYDSEAEELHARIAHLQTGEITTSNLLPLLEDIWRANFIDDEKELAPAPSRASKTVWSRSPASSAPKPNRKPEIPNPHYDGGVTSSHRATQLLKSKIPMKNSTHKFGLIIVFIATIPAIAQQPTILRNATVIDGTGAPMREHVDITLRAGLIESIAPASQSAPIGATVVDCTGKTILPGLISAHSHLGVLENNATPSATAYNLPNVTAALNQFERFGVTTIVSLGLNRDMVYDLRAQLRSGSLGGATLLTAGRGIGVPDGAPPLAVAPDQVDRPTTADEARRDVDDFAAHHADLVKIWVDPLHGKSPEMPPSIYEAAIDQAHKDHLHIAAHEYALADAKQLVADGIDVLAHSVRDQPVDAAFIQAMLTHHTWYIPTLALDESFYLFAADPAQLQSAFFRAAAGPQLLARLSAPGYVATTLADPTTTQHLQDESMARQNLKALFDSGVQIAFGTDSGAAPGRIPGYSEHRELEDLVAAGLTPLQALTIATGRTGQLIHSLDPTLNVGLVSPGYSADLIVLTADPLADIGNTHHIAAVYHRGQLIPNPPPTDAPATPTAP